MEGEIDLVHPGGEDLRPPLMQERAVGGNDGFESPLPRQAEKVGQLRVSQRLPHEVVVEVFRIPGQPIQDAGELLDCHPSRRPPVPVAEGAPHIADVGDLDVDFVVHGFLRW